jgi:hypothetical protein
MRTLLLKRETLSRRIRTLENERRLATITTGVAQYKSNKKKT